MLVDKISAVEAFDYKVTMSDKLIIITDPLDNDEEILKDVVENAEKILDIIGFDQKGLEDRTVDGFVKFFTNTKSENKMEEIWKDPTFNYLMLGRLQSDCEYYLGHGNRSPKVLWALDEKEHIDEMKRLWNELDEKPDWLSMEEILDYEKQMMKTN